MRKIIHWIVAIACVLQLASCLAGKSNMPEVRASYSDSVLASAS